MEEKKKNHGASYKIKKVVQSKQKKANLYVIHTKLQKSWPWENDC